MRTQGRPRTNIGVCRIDGCNKKKRTRGLCGMHYTRQRRHGSPYIVKNHPSYDPEFHHNQGKPFTESDLEYLCKYYEIDDIRTLSYAMGKTEKTLEDKVTELKKEGLYDYYKKMDKYW